MTHKKGILVLVHGASMCVTSNDEGKLTVPDPKHWDKLVWGDPETGAKGRLATALDYILNHPRRHACRLVVGTGLDERDVTPRRSVQLMLDGIKTAVEDNMNTAVYFNDSAAGCWPDYIPQPEDRTKIKLNHHIYGDVFRDIAASMQVWDCANTGAEVEQAVRRCHQEDFGTLVVVSSPAHVWRCGAMASQFIRRMGWEDSIKVIAVETDVDFTSTTVADTVILEGVHQGADNEASFTYDERHLMRTSLVRRIFKIGGDNLRPFRQAFDELLTRFGA